MRDSVEILVDFEHHVCMCVCVYIYIYIYIRIKNKNLITLFDMRLCFIPDMRMLHKYIITSYLHVHTSTFVFHWSFRYKSL